MYIHCLHVHRCNMQTAAISTQPPSHGTQRHAMAIGCITAGCQPHLRTWLQAHIMHVGYHSPRPYSKLSFLSAEPRTSAYVCASNAAMAALCSMVQQQSGTSTHVCIAGTPGTQMSEHCRLYWASFVCCSVHIVHELQTNRTQE